MHERLAYLVADSRKSHGVSACNELYLRTTAAHREGIGPLRTRGDTDPQCALVPEQICKFDVISADPI